MALYINEDCTCCDACVLECPNEAIRAETPIYVIDPERCTECVGAFDEPQCQLVCPPDCIAADPDRRESPEELQAKYDALHADD